MPIDFAKLAEGKDDSKQKPKAVPPKTGEIITLNTALVHQLNVFIAQGEQIRDEAFKIKVTDDKTKEAATDLGSKIHKAMKRIDAEVDEIIEAPKGFVTYAKNIGAKVQKPFEEGKEYLRGEIKQHRARETLAAEQRKEAARKATEALQKKLNEEAKASGIKEEIKVDAIAVPGVDNITRAESGTSYGTKRPKVTVVNLEIVPREYLKIELRTKAVHDAMRQGVTEIPGLELDWEEDIAFK